LGNPARVVIDLEEAHFSGHQRNFAAQSRFLKGVRVGQFRPDVVRVVAEVIGNPASSVFAQPTRVRLELKSRSLTKPPAKAELKPDMQVVEARPAALTSSGGTGNREETLAAPSNSPASNTSTAQAVSRAADFQAALPASAGSKEVAAPHPEPPTETPESLRAATTTAARIPQGNQTTPAQPPVQAYSQQNPGSFVLRTQTNLVLVDVRVWDKSGRLITDLKQSDFRIFEDGKLQTISSFSYENIERLAMAAATAEKGQPPTIDLGKLPPNLPATRAIQDHRLIVLYFDLTSMPMEDLIRAGKAATDFVHKQLTPADLVAVALYSSTLRIVQNFTNDREALDKALKSVHIGESSSLAESATEGEAGTINASGEEVVTQDVSLAFTPDETEFNIFNTDEKLASVESLARMLKDIPGRKSVIHFSSGIQRTGVENQAQLRATEDAANQANVSLYTVDARGLPALPPGGDSASASPSGTALYTGQAHASQVSSLHGGRETLAALAADTGGRTFYDTNDLGLAFSEVQKENSSYYLLGYSPSNMRSDGRFRHIRVEVNRSGVRVESRPGYFAPKDFRQFTRQDRELQLEQAMDLDTPFVDLPMAVETAYFQQSDDKFYVVLAAKIPGSVISFLQKSGTLQTKFDFVSRVTDLTGHQLAVLRDTLPVKLNAGSYEQFLSGNILYEGGFVLPAGKYHVKVVARENLSGKLGTFEESLVLPDPGQSGLALSSVVVSHQLQEPDPNAKGRNKRDQATGASPLQSGGRSLLPSVTRVFRTDQKLYVYLESYGKGAAPSSSKSRSGDAVAPQPLGQALTSPSVALVFFRGGVKISEAGPFIGEFGRVGKTGTAKTTYFVQLPLQAFPPGRYWMQVNVLDPSLDRVAFARVPIAIMKAVAGSAAARAGT
jgi:VWFA-related protein